MAASDANRRARGCRNEAKAVPLGAVKAIHSKVTNFSKTDIAPTGLIFFCAGIYKDLAPPEPFVELSAPGQHEASNLNKTEFVKSQMRIGTSGTSLFLNRPDRVAEGDVAR